MGKFLFYYELNFELHLWLLRFYVCLFLALLVSCCTRNVSISSKLTSDWHRIATCLYSFHVFRIFNIPSFFPILIIFVIYIFVEEFTQKVIMFIDLFEKNFVSLIFFDSLIYIPFISNIFIISLILLILVLVFLFLTC